MDFQVGPGTHPVERPLVLGYLLPDCTHYPMPAYLQVPESGYYPQRSHSSLREAGLNSPR